MKRELEPASLDTSERRTLERLVALLEDQLGPDLRAVWLYGSRARGEQPGEDSDVDLIVVAEGGWGRHSKRVIDLLYEAADAEGAKPTFFSTHVVDPGWPERRRAIDSFFMREVDRDKIVLAGSA